MIVNRRLRNPLRYVLIAAAVLLGCGSAPQQIKLTIKPPDDLNGRRPCYLLVRSVDAKTYLEEPYQAVASKVMQPDDSVVQSVMLFPGMTAQLAFDRPRKGELAVYVLFTAPTGEWKALLPATGNRVELELSSSRLKRAAGE